MTKLRTCADIYVEYHRRFSNSFRSGGEDEREFSRRMCSYSVLRNQRYRRHPKHREVLFESTYEATVSVGRRQFRNHGGIDAA